MSSPKVERQDKRNCTVAVTGKTFEKLEQDVDVLRKAERSASLPTGMSKRGDVEFNANTLSLMKEKQDALKGRVRRGSIFLGSVDEAELEGYWDSNNDVSLHIHGKLSDVTAENTPGAERVPVCYKMKNITDLKDKYKFIYSCHKGAKGYNDTSPNQDNYSYTIYKDYHIMIVMDGHGPCGHRVSTRGVQTLPYYMIKSPHFEAGDIKAMCKDACDIASKDLLGYAVEQDIDVQASGSTIVMFIQKGDQYWTANVGDSRVVIGYEEEKDVVFETMDHKPSLPDEKKRIESLGGEIRTLRYDDFTVDRIFVAGCDYPGLTMSRSFGDECVKAHGVTSEPEVVGPNKLDFSKNPFLVIASDGVWEFIDSAWCVKAMVKKLSVESPERIVQKLAKEARRRWKQEEGEYCDDITVCFAQLKR